MSDISHIHYTGASKVVIRLCEIVNVLIEESGKANIEIDAALSENSQNPVQNRAIAAAITGLQAQITAVQEAIGISPGAITASVENDILVLTGAGAFVKGTRLILLSNSVSASGDTLTFETG